MNRQEFEDKLTALLLGDEIPGYVLVMVDDDNCLIDVRSNILAHEGDQDGRGAVIEVLEDAIEAVGEPTYHGTIKAQ